MQHHIVYRIAMTMMQLDARLDSQKTPYIWLMEELLFLLYIFRKKSILFWEGWATQIYANMFNKLTKYMAAINPLMTRSHYV